MAGILTHEGLTCEKIVTLHFQHLSEAQRFSCGNADLFAARVPAGILAHPYVDGRRIIDDFSVAGRDQTLRSFDVLVNLHIGGVPYVVVSRHLPAELLDAFPVVLALKFKGMSPHIEHSVRIAGLFIQEALTQIPQLGVVMMAGRMPFQIVLGQTEIVRADHGSGIHDSHGTQLLDVLFIVRAVGIRHAAHGIIRLLLKVGTIERVMKEAKVKILEDVRLFDIYRGEQVGEGKKSVSFRVSLRQSDRTITDEEADKAVAKLLRAIEEKLGIKIRD